MLPDSVLASKPVFRMLAARTSDELEVLEKIKEKQEKKRKSRTLEVKAKKSKVSAKRKESKAVSELEPEVIDDEDNFGLDNEE